jgi:L-ascorbate metabolism protein UlaG (beta-lactamase superfamily)
VNLSVTISYFDTAMVLLEIGPFRLLTDPVLDDAGTTFDYGPVHLEKTSRRRVSTAELGLIDAVLLSHDQHGDNLDNAGREFLATVPLVLTTPLAASRLQRAQAEGLEPWASRVLKASDGASIRVTAVPAQHGPEGTQEATGPVTGFMIEWEGQTSGPLYISGDTVVFEGTEEIVARYAPVGLAVLHVGHVELEPMKGAFLSMSGSEAAAFAERLGAGAVLPIHFEGWRHFTEPEEAARSAFASSPVADRVQWLNAGEKAEFTL